MTRFRWGFDFGRDGSGSWSGVHYGARFETPDPQPRPHDWADLMAKDKNGQWVVIQQICQRCSETVAKRVVHVHPADITPAFLKSAREQQLAVVENGYNPRGKVLYFDADFPSMWCRGQQ